jgi:hypothetical protein
MLTDPRIRRPLAVTVVDNLRYGYLVVAITLLGAAAGPATGTLGRLDTALPMGALLAGPAGGLRGPC